MSITAINLLCPISDSESIIQWIGTNTAITNFRFVLAQLLTLQMTSMTPVNRNSDEAVKIRAETNIRNEMNERTFEYSFVLMTKH